MKPLLDLNPNDCRWPTTKDKPFLFCGEPKLAGSSYCACHKRMSVSSDQPKRGSAPGGFILPAFKPAPKRHGLRRLHNNPEGLGTGHRTAVDVHMRRSLETATILQEAGE